MSNEKAAILRVPDVCAVIQISKPTLYLWIREGLFPRGMKYGPNTVGWRRETVEAWVHEKMNPSVSAQG